jgi:hypothetical protein
MPLYLSGVNLIGHQTTTGFLEQRFQQGLDVGCESSALVTLLGMSPEVYVGTFCITELGTLSFCI